MNTLNMLNMWISGACFMTGILSLLSGNYGNGIFNLFLSAVNLILALE